MSKELIKANGILQQASCNSWLKIILNEEFNYNLNKQQFLDAERLSMHCYPKREGLQSFVMIS